MKHEIECIITGRVQLVMLRDFTCRKAKGLGVVGNVQNLDDGSVRIVAQGGKEQLTALIKLLEQGSVLAKVKNVEVVWQEPQEIFTEFKIKY